MEANKEHNAVEKEIAVKVDKDLVKSETVQPLSFDIYMALPPETTVTHHRKNKTNAVQRRELRDKRKCLLKLLTENSADREEQSQLLHEVQDCIKIQRRRRMIQKWITLNRTCNQLEKVWMNRGLPADKESLQSAAASKDPFDMSSLSESLPSKPCIGVGEFSIKAKKLAEEYMSIIKQKTLASVRSDTASVRAANTPENNNNLPSCSSEIHQPDTLADSVVRKLCHDVTKNIRIFSLRPSMRTQKSKGLYISPDASDTKERIESLRKFLLGSEDKINEKTQNLDVETKLQKNPTQNKGLGLKGYQEFHFIKSFDSRPSNVAKRVRQFRDNILLERQMSRLTIANSRRNDLLAGIDESEIKEASSDQNKDEQNKASMDNRRKAVKQKLKALLTTYKNRPCNHILDENKY